MIDEFKKNNKIDGKLNFFVVIPAIKGKDRCSIYQFYLHRGFTKSRGKDIVLEMNNKKVHLIYFLFSKRL